MSTINGYDKRKIVRHRTIGLLLLLVTVLVAGMVYWFGFRSNEKPKANPAPAPSTTQSAQAARPTKLPALTMPRDRNVGLRIPTDRVKAVEACQLKANVTMVAERAEPGNTVRHTHMYLAVIDGSLVQKPMAPGEGYELRVLNGDVSWRTPRPDVIMCEVREFRLDPIKSAGSGPKNNPAFADRALLAAWADTGTYELRHDDWRRVQFIGYDPKLPPGIRTELSVDASGRVAVG